VHSEKENGNRIDSRYRGAPKKNKKVSIVNYKERKKEGH
jgi:hypothetical protein